MKRHYFSVFIAGSLFLSGCATLTNEIPYRSDINISATSSDKAQIVSARVYERNSQTIVRGKILRRSHYKYISGHVHLDLYNTVGTRIDSTKSYYRKRSKSRSLNKSASFTGMFESIVPKQARLVITHHLGHDQPESLDGRLKVQ